MKAEAIAPIRPLDFRFPVSLPIAGLAVAAVGFVLASWSEPVRAWSNLLINGFYFLSISLGALFFISLYYLSNASWCAALRRVPEAMSTFLPWAALLLLGIFLGRHDLYHWTHADAVAHDLILAKKAPYLNSTFFLIRMVGILGLWVAFAHRLRRLSIAQDRSAERDGTASPEAHRRLTRWSAIFMVTFAVTFSVASFDWLMSLEPHWFSTIFAVYTFAGLFQGSLAAITLAVLLLRRTDVLRDTIRPEHLHDLGKLLFAFSTFWAYIWVCQYLLIWYGNLPEEVTYYVTRTGDAWLGFFLLNPILNWVVPFAVLMSRAAKRKGRVLLAVAVVLLTGRWLDLFLQVMPPLTDGPRIGLAEIACFAGCAGLFVYWTGRSLGSAPAVPQGDPLVRESLEYHG